MQIHTLVLALKWTRERLFKSILDRIERVDFSKRMGYAGWDQAHLCGLGPGFSGARAQGYSHRAVVEAC